RREEKRREEKRREEKRREEKRRDETRREFMSVMHLLPYLCFVSFQDLSLVSHFSGRSRIWARKHRRPASTSLKPACSTRRTGTPPSATNSWFSKRSGQRGEEF